MSERMDGADLEQNPSADWRARVQALDAERSFIVQAPAGSGKTELLIQRYLALLSRVQQPEEIAAITFTNKAAAEMRKRVLEALALARTAERPPEPHRALTWEHARAALARASSLGWRLEENAARLRIQTIDALCAALTRQMPVLAAFGAQPESVEDASALYREAARATLDLLEERGARAEDVAQLLAHLDNDVATAEKLLAGMLAKRDHWLRNLRGADERAALEAALAAVRRDAMARVRSLVPEARAGELLALAAYAAENLAAEGRDSAIREAADLARLPGSNEPDSHAWLGLAELLLTGASEWRRTVNVNLGFPSGADKSSKAAAKEWKQRHAALIEGFSDNGDLREALDALRRLPPARYSDEQWAALGAIARVLPLAVAELKLVFAAHGQADFVEIAQGALAALGDPEAPTDLMLALDYRIHHVLVDEFQDTSFTQYALIEKLTAGWMPGDGRTLFLVGDPMQSIYRFREAEVGLFLKARAEGIGQVRLEPLTLSANFRSQADIVDWVNRAFAQVLPRSEDVAAGAVPYSPCESVHPAESDAVRVHAGFGGGAHAEAAQVATLAQAARAEDPQGSVAILVRNRGHLREIVPKLRQAGLRYRAIEIEPLGQRQAVQDLLALTRALAHPADRIAWLAVLRAPWCGLTLADLLALVTPAAGAGGQNQPLLFDDLPVPPGSRPGPRVAADPRTIWEMLADEARLAQLSADGRLRLARLKAVLAHAIKHRLRGSLRERVESAWLALGGPACVANDTDLEDAETYLDYLEDSEKAGEIADPAVFEEGLAQLYALPDLEADPDTAVQILTIHKAKGLEFDTVILPGLGESPRSDERELFVWMERVPTREGEMSFARKRESSLLLAPINPTGSDEDAIYEHIREFRKQKAGHEEGRLLYVAATRAKRHLHLLGRTEVEEKDGEIEVKPPRAGSLLAKLWPAVEAEFAEAARSSPPAVETPSPAAVETPSPPSGGEGRGEGAIDQDLRRLPSDWMLPPAPASVAWNPPQEAARGEEAIEFSWAGETARHVGTVVHRWLQRIAEEEMKGWSRGRVEKLREIFRQELAVCGVEEKEIAGAVERVAKALGNSLEDPRGKWLLGPQREARNEYRVSAVVEEVRRNFVIDRTFVDGQGKRWVVDYKTSSHEGADLEAFLDRERERYAAQIERYARLIAGEGERNLGLYFPIVAGWRDWPFSA